MMFPHSQSFTSNAINMENVLLAKKLATYQPTSLSIDDISLYEEKRKAKSNSKSYKTNNKAFFTPKPIINNKISSNNQKSTNEQNLTHENKFADIFGFHSKKSDNNSQIRVAMQYELPNVKLIRTYAKSRKPLKIVDFSSPIIEA